ncbi:Thioredoxin-like protein [Corchorus capsularis]|uniref:protein disulfide-isomerase n=1 Tax=Corchorus capsularis TaxID=210143 RepID=A0A1R3GSW4_COCAP|nr:Thioredoxin-like protein [Corchorus capsularis]
MALITQPVQKKKKDILSFGAKGDDIFDDSMDATANDIGNEQFDVKGYPTVYFRSSNGNLTPYDGDRTKDDIIDFIEKNRDKTVEQESLKDEL